MFQLTAQNKEAAVRVISLKPGSYSLGRTPENDISVPAASVSSRHCQLTVNENGVAVRDLGSTNGTFANQQPITEQLLYPGDTLRFGDESYILEAEVAASTSGGGVSPAHGKLGLTLPVRPTTPPPGQAIESPMHASMMKRLAAQAAAKPQIGSFWTEMGRSFAYPFRAGGGWRLLIGTLLFAALNFAGHFSLWAFIFGTGYLFAYIQAHITHSASGEHDPADWPGLSSWWEDIARPCLLYFLVGACSFAPLLAYIFFGAHNEPNPVIVFGLGVLGILYLPMALLATAMSDSFTGLNPLSVFPPIARMPLEYLVLCGMLALTVGLQTIFEKAVESLPIPYIKFIAALPEGFVGLYCITVTARALGMLYCTKQEKFGWFD
jgi:hypothetical protein